jgi:hypothetical protein
MGDYEVVYPMTHEYVLEASRGVRWDDPASGTESASADECHLSAGPSVTPAGR